MWKLHGWAAAAAGPIVAAGFYALATLRRRRSLHRAGGGPANAAVGEQRAQTSYLLSQDFTGTEVSRTKCPAALQRSVAGDLAEDLTVVSLDWRGPVP